MEVVVFGKKRQVRIPVIVKVEIVAFDKNVVRVPVIVKVEVVVFGKK